MSCRGHSAAMGRYNRRSLLTPLSSLCNVQVVELGRALDRLYTDLYSVDRTRTVAGGRWTAGGERRAASGGRRAVGGGRWMADGGR